jgi:cytosine/adenosine deaminase-related metal-dependent hydrolase
MPVPRYVLIGRIVTMDDSRTVVDEGALEVDGGTIAGVRPAGDPPPPGWEDVPRIRVHGTVFPGLIELHNHLSYDALPLWQVPKCYADREQWGGGGVPEYRKLVTGPMSVLGSRENLLGPLARYVECKALLGGTTTSQGLGLAAAGGSVRRFFRGLVRNVEDTGNPKLPAATSRIADVPADEAAGFLDRLKPPHRLLLHLSEGISERARRHFLDLHLAADRWALGPTLIGIHATALTAPDFAVLAEHGVGIVWSPLSNLLLYGQTADVAAAQAAGVHIALGGDWSPSGCKNLLGELKAARAAAPAEVPDADLVAMATRTPAALLGWEGSLGVLAAGAQADLLVVEDGPTAIDPYRTLLEAQENDLGLVIINGVPRLGRPALFEALGVTGGEAVRIGGRTRHLNLEDPDEDPLVAGLSLADATSTLGDAMHRLPQLAAEDERRPRLRDGWRLELDHQPDDDVVLPPGLAGGFVPTQLAPPLSTVLEPMTPDRLTAVDDDRFRTVLASERNVPEQVRTRLLAAYGAGT